MRIESGAGVLGVPVVDADGRRLGAVAAAYCTQRAQVLASPAADEDSLDTTAGRARFGRFYQPRRAYTPC